jgi:hypothetical protein
MKWMSAQLFVVAAFSCCFSLVSTARAEGLRAAVTSIVTIDPARPDGETVSLRYNESTAILIPRDVQFIQGIEFELRIPRSAQGAESSIVWELYSAVDPSPSRQQFDYNANRIMSQPLPSRVAMTIQLPVIDSHTLRSGPFVTVIPKVVPANAFPLLFRLSPIGKGFGSAIENADFRLVVRPVLTDEGGLLLDYHFPAEEAAVPVSVFVDDRRIENPEALIVLRKGARVIRVMAEGYKEDILSLAIEAGRISRAVVSFISDNPRLIVDVPVGAIVSMDGLDMNPAEFSGIDISPGEHTIVCRIGDYSLTRRFSALRGKVYRISLSVELIIQADP